MTADNVMAMMKPLSDFSEWVAKTVEEERLAKIGRLRRIIDKQDEKIQAMKDRIRYLFADDVGILDKEEHYEMYYAEDF